MSYPQPRISFETLDTVLTNATCILASSQEEKMQNLTKSITPSLVAVLMLTAFAAYPQVVFSDTPKELYNKSVYESEIEFTDTVVKARIQLEKTLEELNDEQKRQEVKNI
ncbi:hypothetical protein [Candidatus Nitrosotenuis uzonensis]|nr:hypothetical protein [Candidatus Nitrosotenuis uzonensis]